MRLKKLLVAAVGAVAMLVALPAAAHAQYPPSEGTATVDASVVTPGGTVGISGDGFAASAAITISLDEQPLTTTTASPAGTFSARVTIPAGTSAGTHVLSARGRAADGVSERVVSATITVSPTAGTAPPGAPLPRTGSSNSLLLAQAGLASLLVGAALVLAVRARRRGAERSPVPSDS